jgi:lipoprotein-releasing system permease protein
MGTGMAIGGLGTLLGTVVGMTAAVQINAVLRGIELLLQWGGAVLAFLARPIIDIDVPRIELLSESYYLETIPITLGLRESVLTVFFALLTSALASYIPARRAGRLKPLEIMRKH